VTLWITYSIVEFPFELMKQVTLICIGKYWVLVGYFLKCEEFVAILINHSHLDIFEEPRADRWCWGTLIICSTIASSSTLQCWIIILFWTFQFWSIYNHHWGGKKTAAQASAYLCQFSHENRMVHWVLEVTGPEVL